MLIYRTVTSGNILKGVTSGVFIACNLLSVVNLKTVKFLKKPYSTVLHLIIYGETDPKKADKMPRPKKPPKIGYPKKPLGRPVELPTDIKDDIIELIGTEEGKANEMIRRIENIISNYYALTETDKSVTPGSSREAIKPLKKTASKLLQQIRVLDRVTRLNLIVNSCGIEGGFCLISLDDMDDFTQQLDQFVKGLTKSIERLDSHTKQGGQVNEARDFAIKHLLNIFRLYNPEIDKETQLSILETILNHFHIDLPIFEQNETRFWHLYGSNNKL